MQHVKLARDRRKKRSRIKEGVFFIAILLIFSGILLTLKDNSEHHDSPEQVIPAVVDNVEYQSLNTSNKQEEKTARTSVEHQATEHLMMMNYRLKMMKLMK